MFEKLKISTRLYFIILFLLFTLALVGGMGLYGMHQSNNGLRVTFEERLPAINALTQIQSLILDSRLQLTFTLLSASDEDINFESGLIEGNIETLRQLWSKYQAEGELTDSELSGADKFEQDMEQLITMGFKPVIKLLREGQLNGAKILNEEKLDELYLPVRDGLATLTRLHQQETKTEYEHEVHLYNQLRVSFLLLIAGAASLALVVGFLVSRSILRQIGGEPAYAASIMRQVAEGDLTVEVNLQQGDQSSLLATLQEMTGKLSELVTNVRNSSDMITAATRELAQGNGNLSQRTEEQATSLQQTAASMEELTQTVRINADHAGEANKLVTDASKIALKGGQVVEDVIQTMTGIHSSSSRIAEITSAIDSIAFQTNILALNAAVEAARAGEHGRGFAVVASEVRILAQRSAAAAKEIKALISTSSEMVKAGTTKVDQAGATMKEILSSIAQVTDIMGQISSSSMQQSVGIEQINGAVATMDNMTQQNAALVEQAASASEMMLEQASELDTAVRAFRLADARNDNLIRLPEAKLQKPAAAQPVARRIQNRSRQKEEWQEF